MKTEELDPNAAAQPGDVPAEQQQQKTTPKPKEKTKDDLAAIEEFTDKLLGRDEASKKKDAEKEAARVAAEKEAKAKKGEKTDEEKASEAAAATAAEAKKKKAKPAAAAPPPAVDVTDISRAVAEGIRDGLKDKKAGKQEKVEPEPEDDLPEEEKLKIAVLERMEQKFPKYKGRAKLYADEYRAAQKYAADWERKNPGKAFDDNDPEHAEFFDAQKADWSDEDFRKTEIAIEAEKIVEERMKPVNDDLTEWKREKRLAAEAPKIIAQRDAAAKEYWETVGDDFGKLIKEDGSVDKEVFAALEKADPVGLNVTLHYAEKIVEPVAAEIYKLSEGLVEFNPKNRMHADIGAFATQQEDAILQLPPEKHVDGRGRRFATSEEWAKLTPEQRSRRWYLSAERLTQLWTAEKAAEAKQIATAEREKIKKYAGAYAGTGAANPPNAAEQAKPKPGEEEEETGLDADGKPISPSTTGATKVAGSGRPGDSDADKKVLNWAIS